MPMAFDPEGELHTFVTESNKTKGRKQHRERQCKTLTFLDQQGATVCAVTLACQFFSPVIVIGHAKQGPVLTGKKGAYRHLESGILWSII